MYEVMVQSPSLEKNVAECVGKRGLDSIILRFPFYLGGFRQNLYESHPLIYKLEMIMFVL